MDAFSWSDTVKAAFSSCLPCLRPSSPSPSNDVHIHTNNVTHRIVRARPDELEGLLADVPDTDTEAETHSLHSNPGTRSQGRSRKSKRPASRKRITLFGWDLFGRPAIQLPPDDLDDHTGPDVVNGVQTNGNTRPRGESRTRTISSSTLDADAAPLDPSTIEGLSPIQLQERALAAAEEEERRRKRRKERKELKRVARALAMGAIDRDEFEGFQGSGDDGGYPSIPGPFQRPSPAAHGPGEPFGPFVAAQGQQKIDADADDADLGGELYARRSGSGNTSGSDSRSRTSSSKDPSPHASVRQAPHPLTPVVPPPGPRRTNRKSRSSATTSRSTSQSPSLPSPVVPSFPEARVALASPDSLHQRDGGINLGFPSAGFGGVRSKNSDMGAFLARRGDS
jgi:hypothetical protein